VLRVARNLMLDERRPTRRQRFLPDLLGELIERVVHTDGMAPGRRRFKKLPHDPRVFDFRRTPRPKTAASRRQSTIYA